MGKGRGASADTLPLGQVDSVVTEQFRVAGDDVLRPASGGVGLLVTPFLGGFGRIGFEDVELDVTVREHFAVDANLFGGERGVDVYHFCG